MNIDLVMAVAYSLASVIVAGDVLLFHLIRGNRRQRLLCADCLVEYDKAAHQTSLPVILSHRSFELHRELRAQIREAATVYAACALCEEHLSDRLHPTQRGPKI